MNLLDVLDKDLVKVPLQSTTKMAVIEELIDTLVAVKGYSQAQHEEILDVILARERLGSTGIGGGIAIPHAKSEVVDEIVMVLGVSAEAIDFDSPDGELSKIFFLVIAPNRQVSAHVELLASIARTCSSKVFRRLVENAKSSEEVIQLLTE
ncbi:MAG TPA: PTS sugar transporter subunit IIA [Sphaerochaeta sp.]|nr:PTS sugar transporter subunit IIA [Sphaerochaeta sp.]